MQRILGGLVAFACAAAGAAPAQEPRSVVEAEYAFARAAEELGVRASFLKFLATDSVLCAPFPVNGIERVSARPDPGGSLRWYPSNSETAGSGDLGYTLGPWTYRPPSDGPETHGTILSVWRREPDGAWRVVLDCGVNHPRRPPPPGLPIPEAAAAAPAGAAPSVAGWADPVAAAELRFAEAVHARGLAAALREFGADRLHVLLRGREPAVGIERAQALLGEAKLAGHWQHAFVEQSRDGLLGYAWGYIGEPGADRPLAAYVNVWRKSAPAGAWQLVVQSYQPSEPSAAP